MVLQQATEFVQWLFFIFAIVGFILVPLLVKSIQEFRNLIHLYKEYKSEDSDGGVKITLDELISLIERSGMIFRNMSKLFKKIS